MKKKQQMVTKLEIKKIDYMLKKLKNKNNWLILNENKILLRLVMSSL